MMNIESILEKIAALFIAPLVAIITAIPSVVIWFFLMSRLGVGGVEIWNEYDMLAIPFWAVTTVILTSIVILVWFKKETFITKSLLIKGNILILLILWLLLKRY